MTYSVSQFDIPTKEEFVTRVNNDPDSVDIVHRLLSTAGTVKEMLEDQNYIKVIGSPTDEWSAHVIKDIAGNIKAS